MSPVTAIQTAATVGPYSPATVATGRFVFISGQGAIRNGAYHPGTIEDETRMTLENIADLLEQAGTDRNSVTHCRIFLSDIDDFAAVNEIYASFFSTPYPARTTVQAGALPLGVKVEIECIAVVAET
ncbi:RidA family protein [Jiangella muralis]|uniref:RidA family protein n=1 Tax=Jiangella muralis TaxID=702383 RepID=UPI0009F962A1|nr:Rid family detoxifying hydrolase [Jiangella muralis]